jgi:outer membrane autotransporter protein
VTLRVEDPDGNSATDVAAVNVAAPAARVALAELPNLSANKRSIALALDRACVELDQQSRGDIQLTEDQQALLTRCNGLYFDNTQENQTQALDALSAEDFAAARTQTLLFSNTLYASVMDRLVALRGGARGLSLAGLNIVVDGQLVPLAQLQEMAKGLLGGGASSDADRTGGLFGDKVGLWARGNYSFGEKDRSSASPRFEADQWSLIGGLDYRLSERSVIGASFAYGQSGIEFDPAGEGTLDTTSWAGSAYGSLYAAKNFYFDAIFNVAKSDYDAERNITYVDGTGLIDTDAQGTTDGMTLSGGISAGYDFLWGRFTLSPTLGAFYIDAAIDGFSESGAAGLNLIYDEQNFSSLTGNLGLRMTYAVNTGWGVLLPHVRIDYVREFEDDVDVFGVRFAADPNADSAPPILVETDNPDRSYWRLATGFSAQFAHGFSGYVEYQRLESFEFISFEDLSVGLRMQKSF